MMPTGIKTSNANKEEESNEIGFCYRRRIWPVCEAAYVIAESGIHVNLFEMKPGKHSPAHKN